MNLGENEQNIYNELLLHKGQSISVRKLKPFVYPANVQTVRLAIKHLILIGAPIVHTGAIHGSWMLSDKEEYKTRVISEIIVSHLVYGNVDGFKL